VDYSSLIDDFETAYATLAEDAGYILTENLQDRSIRTGLSLAGWKPNQMDNTMAAYAVEWWEWGNYTQISPSLSMA
jgi:polyamine oxidase